MTFAGQDIRDVDPDKVEIEMLFRDTQSSISEWIDYEFNDTFLTPTSGFRFTIGGRSFDNLFARGVTPGARISLRLGSHFVGDGYIDDVEYSADRSSGVVAQISGRDRVGYAVDGHPRRKLILKEGTTLGQALKQILGPLGFTKFDIANESNVALQTGLVTGTKLSKGGKKRGPRPLDSFVLHQTRPYQGEGAWAFASRITQRHGLWLWLSADGETVIASKPDFDRTPAHELRRRFTGDTNVLGGAVKYSMGEQPTVIVADGVGGGGEFGQSRIRAKIVNPACITDDPELVRVWTEFADARSVMMGAVGTPFVVPRCRTLYLHDQSSQTPQQLENFVKREMSLFLRKSLEASYTVIGHGQIVNGAFVPWAVDTMVNVDDEVAGLHETLWVIGRTFSRSRQGGTTTRVQLVRAHSLELGEAEAAQATGAASAKAKKERRPRAVIEEQLTAIDNIRRKQA